MPANGCSQQGVNEKQPRDHHQPSSAGQTLKTKTSTDENAQEKRASTTAPDVVKAEHSTVMSCPADEGTAAVHVLYSVLQ